MTQDVESRFAAQSEQPMPKSAPQIAHELSFGPLWHQADHGELVGIDGLPIRWAALRQPGPSDAIAFSNGRVESFVKYWDLAEELFHQGYSVYLWDHRGQGLSGRALTDRHIGHVDDFDHYVDDLNQLYHQIINPNQHSNAFLLGHSMGGAIATRYLAAYPQHFQAAAFSAPMYGINLPAPKWLLQPLVKLLDRAHPKGFIPGGKPYEEVAFERNRLSSDAMRYASFRALYRRHPELQLGDPSNRWLRQAFGFLSWLERAQVQTPILVMQAGEDTVVDNRAQARFCQRQPQHRLAQFEGARHELLIEAEVIRAAAIRSCLEWFQQHRSPAPRPTSASDSPVALVR